MDRLERLMRLVGNAVVVAGSIYVLVADPDVDPKAQGWRWLARGSGKVAELAGKVSLHAHDKYYKAVSP